MIIQVFLSALLFGVGLLAATQRTTSRLLRIAMLLVVAAGAFFVWAPEVTDRIATAFGVGRGADLIFYIWVIITLALIVFLYLRVARLSRNVTQLARAVALARPAFPRGTKPHPDEAPE